MTPTDQWLKGTFCPDNSSGQETGQYVGILHIRPDLKDWLTSGKPIYFSSYAFQWLEVFAKPHLASTTYACYRQQLKKHILPAFPMRDIRSIETADIQLFFNERRYLHHESQRKLRNILNMIFAAAEDDHLIDHNPTHSPRLKLTNAQKTVRETLSVDAMADIQEVLPKLENDLDKRYLALQMSMALRPCEVLGLRWEDVDHPNGLLHIRRNVVHPTRNQPEVKTLKTEGSVRDLPISTLALPYLQQGGEGFLFGGEAPITYGAFRGIWRRIGRQIDLHGATGYTFRHTILTDLYDATKDVKTTQLYAGHSTPDMTMRRYVHGRQKNLQIAAQTLDDLYTRDK